MRGLILLVAGCVVAGSALVAVAMDEVAPPKPQEMNFTALRGVQHAEVWMLFGTPQAGLDGFYFSTAGLNNRGDKTVTCPPALWKKLDAQKLKARSGWDTLHLVYLNGPRRYTVDSIKTLVGPVTTIDALEARGWGKVELPKDVDITAAGPPAYQPFQFFRPLTLTFEKGKPVFILNDPHGDSWVMQSYSQKVNPKLSYDSLKTLGDNLKPPKGWKYRVVVLEKDLTLTTVGYAWSVHDELQNAYRACKGGAANYKP
jgi:hypothetical protein